MTHTVPSAATYAPDIATRPALRARARVRGKFLFAGDEKLYVRGVTYGPFRPTAEGCEYHDVHRVRRDFAQMTSRGLNAVRTYTVPPRWLLDVAAEAGLYVLVGIGWEQHIAFLDSPAAVRSIEARVREAVRACAGHPAVLAYAIGNEIPAAIVRWHGRRRVARFLEQLYRIAKTEDPGGLVTYVNYPTTEYLELPFVDFVAFNVYLEEPERLEAYLARLQNLAGDRPLVMAEVGLDSRRNGEERQAAVMDWQIRSVFRAGCAGMFVFAWTDEWYRGGYDIDDWDFGLVRRDRSPKPALRAVETAFAAAPCIDVRRAAMVSVVVCTHNGARTLRDCLDGLRQLDYPRYEVIVVDDGSRDASREIAEEFGVRVISGPQRGLSAARNIGLAAARGDIVAYTDDDARPDPQWLTYLVDTFERYDFAAVGGPNIAPPGDGFIADCVANAPGGPVHVLLDDRTAEHIPGCNMAFRADRLRAIGGFDVQFRAAGDDVDVCWRIQERGWKIGFSPAAMVWHHRRNSVGTYWRQQQGYGRAEALLEAKWPAKYNSMGHVSWGGRIYGNGLTRALRLSRGRIYHGSWGSAPFQSIYEPAESLLACFPLMPEWFLGVVLLAVLTGLGALWAPLYAAAVPLAAAGSISLLQAALSARRGMFTSAPAVRRVPFRHWLLTTALHLVQPIARLRGRIRHGLTPWRTEARAGLLPPVTTHRAVWCEQWQPLEARLAAIRTGLLETGVSVQTGGNFDEYDLEAVAGVLGAARTLATVEEHGAGRQYVRFRIVPHVRPVAVVFGVPLAALTAAALRDGAWAAAAALALMLTALVARSAYECAAAMGAMAGALHGEHDGAGA